MPSFSSGDNKILNYELYTCIEMYNDIGIRHIYFQHRKIHEEFIGLGWPSNWNTTYSACLHRIYSYFKLSKNASFFRDVINCAISSFRVRIDKSVDSQTKRHIDDEGMPRIFCSFACFSSNPRVSFVTSRTSNKIQNSLAWRRFTPKAPPTP